MHEVRKRAIEFERRQQEKAEERRKENEQARREGREVKGCHVCGQMDH